MDRFKQGEVRPVNKIQPQRVATNPVLPNQLSGSTPCMKTMPSSNGVLQERTGEDNTLQIAGLAKTPPIVIPVPLQKNNASSHYSHSGSSSEEEDAPVEFRQQNPLPVSLASQPGMSAVLQLCCNLSPRAWDSDVDDLIAQLTLLVQRGESLHARDSRYGRTALHWACIKGHPGLVRFLCNAGARQDMNARDLDGKTPLHYVLQAHFANGRAELVTFLLQQGADLSLLQDGGASLVYAHYMTPELALLLMQRGLDFHSKSRFSETPLMIACDKGDAGLVKFLLGQRVSPAMMGTLGRTPLHNGQLPAEVASWLIRAGATVDAADDLGETPLMLACEVGNLPLATLLLQHGASPLAVSASGKSVLDYAKKAGGAIAGGFVLLMQQGAGSRSVQD